MNGNPEAWHIGDLRPDPRNVELFEPMEEKELQDLAASIKEVGLINPITIRSSGAIIAGEQRWRAAQVAGVELVPVIVRDVTDDEAEALRIAENLRRRTIPMSARTRAVRRLFELHQITERKGAGRPKQEGEDIGMTRIPVSDEATTPPPPVTVADIARTAGVSVPQVKVLNRLADLIPSLMKRLEAGTITQKMAYGFAQLPASEQEEIAATLETKERELATLRDEQARFKVEMDDAVATLAAQKDAEIQRTQAEADELRAQQKTLAEQAKADKEEEKRARQELERANRQLKKDLKDFAAVEHWKRHDKMHATLQMLDKTMTLRPQECAEAPKEIEALRAILENDRQTAEAAVEWLREYAHALGERLGITPLPLRSL